jgi:hypothetical protein
MAKITDKIREKILADFHIGFFSIRQIAERAGVSHVAVHKIVKGLTPKFKEKINAEVAFKAELADENLQQINSVNEVISEATKHLIFFQNAALTNQKKANEMLKNAKTIGDIEAHSRITARNKETILGKEPQTIINNNNTQQNQKPELDLSGLSNDELETLDAILSKAN